MPLAFALDDVLDLEIVHHHAPLEEHHQGEGPDRITEVIGVPLLRVVDTQDAVSDVTVFAENIGVRVMHVVVRVTPLVGRAHRIPFEDFGIEPWFTHPVVLTVHDVVADLHVVEDLGHAQCTDCCEPHRRQEAEVHQAATCDLEPALSLDDLVDVLPILRPERGDGAIAQCVQLAADLLDLLVRQDDGSVVLRIGTVAEEREGGK